MCPHSVSPYMFVCPHNYWNEKMKMTQKIKWNVKLILIPSTSSLSAKWNVFHSPWRYFHTNPQQQLLHILLLSLYTHIRAFIRSFVRQDEGEPTYCLSLYGHHQSTHCIYSTCLQCMIVRNHVNIIYISAPASPVLPWCQQHVHTLNVVCM